MRPGIEMKMNENMEVNADPRRPIKIQGNIFTTDDEAALQAKMARMAELIREVLYEAGFNTDALDDTKRTPLRFVKYLMEFMKPIDLEVIKRGISPNINKDGGIVAQTGIPFRMICRHHLLPATGRASIGYIPTKNVLGLSKLTRLVQSVGTHRPGLQEHIGNEIANLLEQIIEPRGTIVTIHAEHSCMACRGINTPGVITHTSVIRGAFRDSPHAREEFFALIKSC